MVKELQNLEFIIDDIQRFLNRNEDIDEDLWIKLDDCKDFIIEEIKPLFE